MLDKMGWLDGSSPDLCREIARRVDRIALREGRTIYRFDDPAGGLYCIVEGRLDLHLPRWGSEHSLAHVFGPGWWIGEMAAISGRPRRFDAFAQRDSLILRLSKAEIDRICDLFPQMYLHLLRMTTINMHLILDAAEAFGFANPSRRVAASLLRLDFSGQAWNGQLAVTQGEIAQIAKLSRRSTNSVLQALSSTGIVKLGYGEIAILDRPALRAIVDDTAQGL